MTSRGGRGAVALALLLCLLAAAPAPRGGAARAGELHGLYETEAAVGDKEPGTREQALRQMLVEVVRKVSGERNPAAEPAIEQALPEAQRYVQQFGYRSAAPASSPAGENSAPRLMLWARFDPRALDRLLSDAGLPVWGRVRPSLLVWLAVEREGGRELVGADDAGALGRVLQETARQRGVPLILPLLDLQDRARVSVSDVWAGFGDALRAASERYQAESVLIGRAAHALPGLWETRWRLLMLDGRSFEWSTRDDLLEAALADGVQDAADRLASLFARAGAGGGLSGVELTVSGVHGVADYARTLRYLESLEVVSRVEVTGVKADEVSFRVQARGGGQALDEMIALTRTLAPVDFSGGSRYRLLP